MSENPFAFPATAIGPAGDEYLQEGMTLRDWFAGQVISGGYARTSGLRNDELDRLFGPHRRDIRREEIIAAEAYIIADAMLAQRARALTPSDTGGDHG